MKDVVLFGWVVIAGILFSAGDVFSKRWTDPAWQAWSNYWFVGLCAVAITAYSTMGYLMKTVPDFSKVAIWVSISMTICSCIWGLTMEGDKFTENKFWAFAFALIAAYFSSK